MNKINIITLFPQAFDGFFNLIPYKNLLNDGTLQINLIDLRDFGIGNYKKVDDSPYGGGPGMVLMVEPIYNALQTIETEKTEPSKNHKILLSPRGKRFNQQKAAQLKEFSEVTLICGRYEGVDARVEQLCDELISIGDFVLAGGEAAALSVMEASLRLKEGALGDIESTKDESFSDGDCEKAEYPQYTRPEDFMGLKVPTEIISGNHKLINKWRQDNKLTQSSA